MADEKRPTLISTFAGCGGSSLGYKWAGFEELLAIEWEKNAVETLRLNFPGLPVWQKDITKVEAGDMLAFCGLQKGELDVLDGSPPCQGFSMAGKRQVNDPRNDLFKDFLRLIDGLQPKVFLMENVSGVVKGRMRGRFIEIMKDLKALNYVVTCRLMNTAYHGVPQSRQRLIWIGVRKDLDKQPLYPPPRKKIITVQEALADLVITERRSLPGPQVIRDVLLRCREGEDGAKYNDGKFFGWQRISRNRPCPTIIKTASLFHWSENRYLTIQELKRLSSFPDGFQFIGSHRQQWARIGNAVMPRFMEAIAKTIREEILN